MPVSYTHLDVYKRQGDDQHTQAADGASSSERQGRVRELRRALQPQDALHGAQLPHRLKLLDWLDIKLGMEQPSVPFIRGVVNMRNYKTAEELVEIEHACNVTADMETSSHSVPGGAGWPRCRR